MAILPPRRERQQDKDWIQIISVLSWITPHLKPGSTPEFFSYVNQHIFKPV